MVKEIKTASLPIRPRFPIATMFWYSQYSDQVAGRAGTIKYVMSLTPGLTEDIAGSWVDELIQASGSKVEDEKTEELVVKAIPAEI